MKPPVYISSVYLRTTVLPLDNEHLVRAKPFEGKFVAICMFLFLIPWKYSMAHLAIVIHLVKSIKITCFFCLCMRNEFSRSLMHFISNVDYRWNTSLTNGNFMSNGNVGFWFYKKKNEEYFIDVSLLTYAQIKFLW